MNKKETIALWQRCEEARAVAVAEGKSDDEVHEAAKAIWNAWADAVIAERGTDEEPSEAWQAKARVDFGGQKFEGFANFSDFHFPWHAEFVKAQFSGRAGFVKAKFYGDALFGGAEFGVLAWFHGAKFYGKAWLIKAQFDGDAWFDLTRFEGYVAFPKSNFEKAVSFNASRIESAFNLEGAEFGQVPNFTQAHFVEAPRLDNVRIHRGKVEPDSFLESLTKPAEPYVTSHYRSLKRLAIQAHHHDKEQAFFASELRTRRNVADMWWQPAWWFGVFYEVLSNYGRSLWRPLVIWLASTLIFAGLYLCKHVDRSMAAVHGLADFQCVDTRFADAVSPVSSAMMISLQKGLFFFGLGNTEKVNQSYACLYGFVDDPIIYIPDSVAYLGLFQTLISLVLLFLFLLAVRNHFKLR